MSLFSSPRPLGHFSAAQTKMAGMLMDRAMMDLGRQKMVPGCAVEAYMECLNRLLEPLAILQGIMGLRTWLHEVQYFMSKLKQRSYSGMPLAPRERQVIGWYSARWRSLRGGPCDMGRPEAQIILMSLSEMAMF